MNYGGVNTAIQILEKLVAFETVSHQSNLKIADYVEHLLSAAGGQVERFPSEDGTKVSLWATFGPDNVPGIVLSGHVDTYPIVGQNWTFNPLQVTRSGDKLYGRGTCDMKGFVAACLATLPLINAKKLKTPIHFAFSYDEEVGITGVRPMLRKIAQRPVRPFVCIVGEPTQMKIAIGHKGKRAESVTVKGRTVHSSLAPQGVNAVICGAAIIQKIEQLAENLAQAGTHDDKYAIPYSTANVGVAHGGIAVSSVPDEFKFTYEFRVIPGDSAEALVDEVHTFSRSLLRDKMKPVYSGSDILFEHHTSYPGLEIDSAAPAVSMVKSLLGSDDLLKVPYGTEAGLFQQIAGIPSVVLGPGSIAQAHRADEYLEIGELERALSFLSDLAELAHTDAVLNYAVAGGEPGKFALA